MRYHNHKLRAAETNNAALGKTDMSLLSDMEMSTTRTERGLTRNDSIPKFPKILDSTLSIRLDTEESETVNESKTHVVDLEMEACDIKDMDNPQLVAEYASTIFKYLRETEGKYSAKHGYMANQPDITDKMRAILVDWLVDVHLKFKLLPETLFLTINIIDRYLDHAQVTRQKLQLVGVTAMLIACKYEEIYSPEINDFVYVTDNAYTREEILETEGKILAALKFNITTPSSYIFLERYAKVHGVDERTLNLARYLIELALVEYKLLKYSPSNIACSALYLACKVLKKEAWNDTIARVSQYTESQVRPCAKDLCVLLQHAHKTSLQAVRKKFASSKYMEISKIQLDKH